MWKQLSAWLCRVSTGTVTLAALLVFVVFAILVLPGQSAAAQEMGSGAGSPDTSLFYSPDDLYRMAEAYGQEGRAAYVQARWTFDLAFPIVYGAALITAISWLSARFFPAGSRLQLANLAPVLAVIFDYLENTCTSLVMFFYPTRLPALDRLAPVFTSIKWLLVFGSFALLVLGVGAWLRRRGKKEGATT
jgi:hypothetical protein